MADIEILKLVSNIGAFGLMAIFVVWVLFRASPQVLDAIAEMNKTHSEAYKSLAADHKEKIIALAGANERTVANLAKEFREALSQQTADCRAERAEVWRRHEDQIEKDRAVRHAMADKFQAMMNQFAVARVREAVKPHKGDSV